ncbi:aspartate 1-decarboxylase [Dissulfurirhabdus thermomarina]|uniref:Aspartate 1-decarboxylase n=1 Tax=Dissulfurirhabdus thermomarina TaxID=1765737 RepID=A0A6N9TQD2_DISTH|nr:aspartate 1-decarboxylase [Dissulfurirhabdus thermomarina]NDY42313.1 aspartate 1-decarboxylase [Dissulfurirhabdus thermomarina]NMX22420.1 aspartate 1-decarboxylase [Dissulfurirhabdus thermomarina]
MLRTMLNSKIHRARVTEARLDYEGSLSLDPDLMEAAGLLPYEQVRVYNISTGERFETYVIKGDRPGSGTVCLNGAAARKGSPGDLVIIASYGLYAPEEIPSGQSILVWVDEHNRVARRKVDPWSA